MTEIRASIGIYSNARAWLIGIVYFAVCWVLAVQFGVWEKVTTDFATIGDPQSLGWYLLAGFWALQIVVGYAVIWPKGTVTFDRKFYPTAIVFGLLWGLAEGQLFLVYYVWASEISNWIGAGVWGAATITFLMVSVFNMAWHLLVWDNWVAPTHNIEEWNLKKVQLTHSPNLMLGLVFLSFYNDFFVFVALQTIALTISTCAMKFPPFWKTESEGAPVYRGGSLTQAEIDSL